MARALIVALVVSLTWFFFKEEPPQNEIKLPQPTGMHGVGTLNVELSDPSRFQLRSKEPRRWMVTIFYPTNESAHPSLYMPGTLKDGGVCGTKVWAHATPHAQPLTNQKLPLIISIPGRGGERQKETILYESLASHGYIVAAMDQPYVANFVHMTDGTRYTLTFKDAWNLPRNRDYRYQYDDEVIAAALQDIDFVLQHLEFFEGVAPLIDPNGIILMGHSLGGNIAHIKGFADKRIKAVVDIDSKITERPIFGCVGVPLNPDNKPVLFIRANMQYQEDVKDQLEKTPNSTVWTPQVQHCAFTDGAYFSAKISHFGMGFWSTLYNWLFKKGPYFSKIDTDLGPYTADEWFKEYPKHIIQWLNAHVSEDKRI